MCHSEEGAASIPKNKPIVQAGAVPVLMPLLNHKNPEVATKVKNILIILGQKVQ
jgi:hypothetical protein